MTIIEIKPDVKINLDELLHGVSKLGTTDLEQLHQKLGRLLDSRKPHRQLQLENRLLAIIQKPLLASDSQKIYDALREKQRADFISTKEHQQYMRLVQEMERNSVERLRCLIELAQIRGVSIPELMRQLDLPALNPANA